MKCSRRCLIRIFSFGIFALIVLIARNFQLMDDASKSRLALANNYSSAVEQLADACRNVSETLEKQLYTNSPDMHRDLAVKLYQQASAAKAALSQLPMDKPQLDNTYKFLSQVGNYSLSVTKKLDKDKTVSQKDYDNISKLYDFSKTLSEDMWELENEVTAGELDLENADLPEKQDSTPSVIDGFSDFEEKYGFHEGNELLIKVAHMIEDSFKGSLVSRFSDDHFVVLTRIDGAKNIIGHLSGEIKKLQREVHLELKCGAYKPVGDEADVSLACDRARFACNSIKKHYDRTLRIYDKSLEDKFQLKHYIVNNIDNAIASGYIKVYYQPVVSTRNGCICGLEALARWEDPNYGLLSPGAFIEILEEYRQIYKLDQYIIEAVCRDYRDASDNKKPFAPVSLNFSRLDFELCDIVGYLCETVEKYGVPKNFIDIEITESALTDQQDFLPNAIKNLRSFGYKVWLDDFGSGYSSLNVLKDYQFDVLKIDMKFLSGFKDNEKTRPILENIVSLTKQLKMLSLTEGVETAEQFSFLEAIGCDRAQGYLFSKPVPIETLRERISAGELKISPELSA